MRKKFKSALDYVCERWHKTRAFVDELRDKLATAQPGSKDYVYFARRVKQIEIEAGLWEGRVKEGVKPCISRHAN